jgi:hypothetical protein
LLLDEHSSSPKLVPGFASAVILDAITGDCFNAALLTVIAAAWSAITYHQWRHG